MCRNSCRTIWARPASRVRWWWHPRRPYRHGARHCRARALSGHQHPQIDLPHHAAGGRPGLSAGHQPGAPGNGDYADMEELIRLGAYRTGSSAEVDGAIALHKPLEAFLSQLKEESTSMAEGYQRLEQILQAKETEN